MKVLLLVPKRYSLFASLQDIFVAQGAEIFTIDYYEQVRKWEIRLNSQMFRFPDKYRLKWEAYYLRKINQYYVQQFDRIQPDLVFVYNNEMLTPEAVAHFKKRSKLAFFLGDNPFYTPTSRYFLPILFHADAIYAPDTFWISQLRKLGLKNIHYFLTGIPENSYFEKELAPEVCAQLRTEALYVGMCYPTVWGYKKAQFLNHFTNFELQIHGNRHWKRWFGFFPALEKHFREREGYIPVEQLNDMYNASKIIPVDSSPGIMNGVHLRMFEALGAGALPLLEWQTDLEEIFGAGADLPAVKSYDEAPAMTAYYLRDEQARREKTAWMKNQVRQRFSLENNRALIVETLGLQ